MILLKKLLYLFLFFNINFVNGEDVFATINTIRSLNVVDEKFVSFVIDPMMLLSGLNISKTTLNLARHLSPAFIRLHGPSTPSFIFSVDDTPDTEERLTVTPDMWTSLNEWISAANLTAVFALSDRERVNQAWNARTVLPLMEMSDKMNLNCYWELGNECNMTMKQYLSDLDALLHIQDAFPRSKNKWRTVAGEMSKSLMSSDYESVKKVVHSLIGKVKAINWNPPLKDGHDLNFITKYIMTTKPKIPVWTNAPRTPEPTSFTNGLLWAKYLGDSAKLGYDVVFRQPKIREFFEVTPAYWVSYLHKILMGRNVLDIRASNAHTHSKTYMYAHCAKRQNDYSLRGAATLFMVNMQDDAVNGSIRFMSTQMKSVEIQSYVLTSPDENTSTVFLNGDLLDSELTDTSFSFLPSVRRANVGSYLTITLPPRSVGFFVIPAARLHVCIQGEDEIHLIRQEIAYQQDPILAAEKNEAEKVENLTNMNELYKMMEEELESNEKYYQGAIKRKEWRQLLIQKAKEAKLKNNPDFKLLTDEERNKIINKAKLMEKQKKYIARENKFKEELRKQQIKNMKYVNVGTPEEEKKKIKEANEDLATLLGQPQSNFAVKVGNDPTIRAKRGIEDLLYKLRNKNRFKPNTVLKAKPKYVSESSSESKSDNSGFCDDSEKDTSLETDEIGEKEASKRLPRTSKDVFKIRIEKFKPKDDDNSIEIEEGRHLHHEYFEDFGHHRNDKKLREDLKGYEICEVNNCKDILDPVQKKMCQKKIENQQLMVREIKKLRALLKKYNASISKSSESNEFEIKRRRSKREIKTDLSEKLREKRLQFKAKMLERKAHLENKLKDRKARKENLLAKTELNRIKRFAVINVPEDKISDTTFIPEITSDKPDLLIPYASESNESDKFSTENAAANKDDDSENIFQAGVCPFNFTGEDSLAKLLDEPIVLLVGNPVDLSKIVIDERKRERQLRFLKTRLAQKRRIEERKARHLQQHEKRMNKHKNDDEVLDIKKRSIDNNLFNNNLLDNNKYNNLLMLNEIRKDNLDDSNTFNLLFNQIKKDNEKLRDNEFDIIRAAQNQQPDKSEEAKVILNDISKEGKMISNFLKEAEDDVYKLIIAKPKDMKKANESEMVEIKKMNDKKLDKITKTLENKLKDGFIDLNVYNPVKRDFKKVETSPAESSTPSSTVTEIEDMIHEEDITPKTGDDEGFVPKFTIVNDLFDTLTNMLGNLHNRVVSYAVYLTQ